MRFGPWGRCRSHGGRRRGRNRSRRRRQSSSAAALSGAMRYARAGIQPHGATASRRNAVRQPCFSVQHAQRRRERAVGRGESGQGGDGAGRRLGLPRQSLAPREGEKVANRLLVEPLLQPAVRLRVSGRRAGRPGDDLVVLLRRRPGRAGLVANGRRLGNAERRSRAAYLPLSVRSRSRIQSPAVLFLPMQRIGDDGHATGRPRERFIRRRLRTSLRPAPRRRPATASWARWKWNSSASPRSPSSSRPDTRACCASGRRTAPPAAS